MYLFHDQVKSLDGAMDLCFLSFARHWIKVGDQRLIGAFEHTAAGAARTFEVHIVAIGTKSFDDLRWEYRVGTNFGRHTTSEAIAFELKDSHVTVVSKLWWNCSCQQVRV
jgi:hypothetical protein